tara:strand:- start:108 stop:614 length:507 start_codon:yes stop_codon:yes gene_type:complete
MKKFNLFILDLSVGILDRLYYKSRSIQRFWVLEVIARAPYFAFLSVLHLQESLGLKTPLSNKLMKSHFYQAINETEHLEEMESRGGSKFWVDRFLSRHLVLFYYWGMVFYYVLSPSNAYDINLKIEEHPYETYSKYLDVNPNDQRIREIAQDEINHANELKEMIALIS